MAKSKRPRRKPVRSQIAERNEGEGWETLFQSMGRIEIVLLVGAVLLILVLIYTIQSILSPFLALGAILFLLFPMRRYALARNLMWLSISLFGLWFLDTISGILAPFVVSLVIAYLLNPVVTGLEGWKIPRWVSSLVLILLVVGVIILILFFVLPIAVAQFESMLDALSGVFAGFREWLWKSRMANVLERYGVSAEDLQATLTKELAPRFEDILKSLLQGILAVMSSLSKFVTQIFYVIIIPFLTFYVLADFPKISHRFLMLIPGRQRPRAGEYLNRADEIIGRYLRGALFVAFLQGILVTLIFSLFGIKYSLLLGMTAALLDLVPYFGLIITMILAGVVALFSDPPIAPKVASAVATIGLLHLLEVTLLAPRIVGSRVGMHPLLIILSLLVFAYFLGFVGLLIAVPVTALIILAVREYEASRRGIPLSHFHSSAE
ncbi:MAG: AI-2E family transporter [Ignavibacteriales bacterium]|nr:AI-2E family transporter [Ignavibacteriales bacterium]